jgi:superfamily II DNA/RNA helicase
METLDAFKRGEMTLLVCSDVAARGLDIDDLSHVFNFDVPIHAEDYVHRIGRTGRAGRSGRAFTLATGEDRRYLDAIERLIGKQVPKITIEGVGAVDESAAAEEGHGSRSGRGGRGRGGRSRGGRNRRSHGEDRDHQQQQAQHEQPQQAAPRHQEPRHQEHRHQEQPRAEKPHKPAPLPRHPFDDARSTPAAGASNNHSNGHRPPVREDRPAQQERPHREHRRREERDDGPAQVGLGDHMPAFLMRGRRAIG